MNGQEWGIEKLRRMVEAQGGPAAFARAWSRNVEETAIDQTYFWSMVTILVQLAIAAVPAALLLAVLAGLLLMLIPHR